MQQLKKSAHKQRVYAQNTNKDDFQCYFGTHPDMYKRQGRSTIETVRPLS